MQLKEIPFVLASETLLRVLDAPHNEISSVPAWLSKLKLLRLDLTDNHISGFPIDLPDSISELRLGKNRLFYAPIPPLITRMVNLEHLELFSNQLEYLFFKLGTCRQNLAA